MSLYASRSRLLRILLTAAGNNDARARAPPELLTLWRVNEPRHSERKGCKPRVHCHGDRVETRLPEKPVAQPPHLRYNRDLRVTLRTDTRITAPFVFVSVCQRSKYELGTDEAADLQGSKNTTASSSSVLMCNIITRWQPIAAFVVLFTV